ncbi:serine hydrolase domain-containing protein [Roseovarius atlanticus]|uniref:serine hydrolase domain-containing protein n=2 Tax=Roseovarius atlanticus TaxID=1641875 RepID=UPI001C9690A8|nr:serine hydrolase domain-containing protein [Roseovarius atlanticus]MBY6125936.1 beta-lactamase family protein [Roseovarius atlanticus]
MQKMLMTSDAEHHPSSREPFVATGFERVQSAFHDIQGRPEELGSALCVYKDGKPVLNIWGGVSSSDRKGPWQSDTVVSLFSAGKALTALCLLHLADKGVVDLDDPVVTYWPEFARADARRKSRVTLSHLLHHSAGLPASRTSRYGDVWDWERMVSSLEKASLLWPAGEHTAYHAVTFGHLVGEVIRRVSGQMPSEYFADHFATPLGLDLATRLMPHQKDRLATCDSYSRWTRLRTAFFASVLPRMGGWHAQYLRPCSSDYHPNSARWQNAEAPAITGFGTAEGLARLYAMLAGGGALDGVRVFSKEMIARIANERPAAVPDLGIRHDVRVGHGMYFNLGPMADLGPNPNSFGHVGMGGVTSFADPDTGIGFGYVCNHLFQPDSKMRSIIGERAAHLAKTLYDCLP